MKYELIASLESLGNAVYTEHRAIPGYANRDLDVSTEGFLSDLFARVGDAFRNTIQNIRDMPNAQRIIADSPRFLKLIKLHDYASIEALNTVVPSGLKVDYLVLAELTVAALVHSSELPQKTLEPFRAFVTKVISDPRSKYDIRKDILNSFKDRAKSRQNIERALQACFSNSQVKVVPYGKAIQRNADWESVFAKVSQAGQLAGVDRKILIGELEELGQLVDKLTEIVKNDKEFGTLNQAAAAQLSELTKLAAEEITFLSVSYYYGASLYTNLSFAVKDLIVKLR